MRAILILLAGIGLLLAALIIQAIFYETLTATIVIALAGLGLTGWGGYALRSVLGGMARRRRIEIALHTLGVIGIIIALGYMSVRYPARVDLTEAGLHSLSEQSIEVLGRLEKPVHINFFHSHLMEKTINLYRLIAKQSSMVTVEFHDPTLNPAQARLLNVRFPGIAVMTSDTRRVDVNGELEADIINGVLRVSQGATQKACFLDGHGEADPFSMEQHDHLESQTSHSHGTGVQYVLHETHGFAKASNGLEELNYTIEKVSLLQAGLAALDGCAVLIVAGPKTELLSREVEDLRTFMAEGGNAFLMVDPFVDTGLGRLLRDYGVVLDDTMVIDPAHHFAADPSSPAVTDYNNHQVTRALPLSFFPGARSLSPGRRVAGTSVTPVINSSANSFGETSIDRAERNDKADIPGPLTIMVAINKRPTTQEEQDVVANLERREAHENASPLRIANGRSRMVVIGDSDFATNSFFHILGNGNLFLNTVNYLAAQENLIGIEPHTRELPEINFTNRQMKATFFLAVFLFPLLLGLIGTAIWWRQR
ncbi:MAG TPA: GldG family protein [Alphaproteobacteria bacterium]|jgi:ABC-type uncharacterized transport system involved in gliding motility auxiliary subunit|nr:GldG family protein [Alphaproteobacteria bacterium]